jgi:aspartate kinase
MKYGVRIHVRSSFSDVTGTWVVPEESEMEKVVVSGVTVARDEAKITVEKVPDSPGIAARLFTPLSDNGVVVDMIIQNASSDGTTDMTFTVPAIDRKRTTEILKREVPDLVGKDGERVKFDDEICKVSVVGVGMRSHAGVAKKMFQLLAADGINIQLISTSEIKISCVVAKKYAELALRALHDGFALDRPPSERQSL